MSMPYRREVSLATGALHNTADMEAGKMPYRKVTYLEQCWYLILFMIRELLRGEEKRHDGE